MGNIPKEERHMMIGERIESHSRRAELMQRNSKENEVSS